MEAHKPRPFYTWIRELKEFLEDGGGRAPMGSSDNMHERCLAGWLSRARESNKKGTLSEEHKEAICELPGMRPRVKTWDDSLLKEKEEPVDPSELAAASGLSEELLAALPPDAPAGHVAHKKAKYRMPDQNVVFTYGENKINFQTTASAVGWSQYAAERICRACYLKFDEGLTKDEVRVVRGEWYKKFNAARARDSDYAAPAVEPDRKRGHGGAKASKGKKRKVLMRKAPGMPGGQAAEAQVVVALSDSDEETAAEGEPAASSAAAAGEGAAPGAAPESDGPEAAADPAMEAAAEGDPAAAAASAANDGPAQDAVAEEREEASVPSEALEGCAPGGQPEEPVAVDLAEAADVLGNNRDQIVAALNFLQAILPPTVESLTIARNEVTLQVRPNIADSPSLGGADVGSTPTKPASALGDTAETPEKASRGALQKAATQPAGPAKAQHPPPDGARVPRGIAQFFNKR